MTRRECLSCHRILSITQFRLSSKLPDGYSLTCKACTNRFYAPQRKTPPKHCWEPECRICERGDAYRAHRQIRTTYGITLKQRAKLLVAQRNCCAICETPFALIKLTHTDHDHVSGKVRGILCQRCNVGLGMLRDDVAILNKAIKYVEAAKETNEVLLDMAPRLTVRK